LPLITTPCLSHPPSPLITTPCLSHPPPPLLTTQCLSHPHPIFLASLFFTQLNLTSPHLPSFSYLHPLYIINLDFSDSTDKQKQAINPLEANMLEEKKTKLEACLQCMFDAYSKHSRCILEVL
jgi:hypothetical protein